MTNQKHNELLEVNGRPYLDFYKRHKIAPVSQNISDLQKHFSRRENLHRYLGLLPSSFENKRVIEFGPGCGHNAIYVNSLKPSQFVLVDANPVGLKATRENLKQYAGGNHNYEVVESLIEEYQSDGLFDIVFCEGVIPYQRDSIKFLKHIATYVAEGGVLVVTCMDSVSTLSEILRQIIRVLAVDGHDPINKQLEILRPMFKPHLDTLTNMSRPVDDWILDSMIQPIPEKLMSMQEAIHALSGEFDIYGSSPKIITDWRWYKDIYGDRAHYNDRAIDAINKNVHNLMDYRFMAPPQSAEMNNRIVSLCDAVFQNLKELEHHKDLEILKTLNENLRNLSEIVDDYSPGTAVSIDDFRAGIEHYLQYKRFPELKDFASFFGRGQQYLSFTKKKQGV